MNFPTSVGYSNRLYTTGVNSMPSYLGYAGNAVSGIGAGEIAGDVQVAGQTFNPAGTGFWPVRAGYLSIMPLKVRGFKGMTLDTIGDMGSMDANQLPLSTSVNARLGRTDGLGEAGLLSGWGSLWDVVTGKEADRGIELNKKITAANEAAVAAGTMTQAQADTANSRLDDPSTYRTQVYDAFEQGALEGLAAEQSLVKNTTTGLISGTLGFVPWWGWVVGAAVLANYLGVFSELKGSLAPSARSKRRAMRQNARRRSVQR